MKAKLRYRRRPILITSGATGSGQLAYATVEQLYNSPKKTGCNPTERKRAWRKKERRNEKRER